MERQSTFAREFSAEKEVKCARVVLHFERTRLPLGFGSMLRALGAQINRTTNKEACRDLSGRRMRDVNAQKTYDFNL